MDCPVFYPGSRYYFYPTWTELSKKLRGSGLWEWRMARARFEEGYFRERVQPSSERSDVQRSLSSKLEMLKTLATIFSERFTEGLPGWIDPDQRPPLRQAVKKGVLNEEDGRGAFRDALGRRVFKDDEGAIHLRTVV